MPKLYRLEKITLHGIGVFDDTHLDFPENNVSYTGESQAEIHIFTGPNGSGKSTLLYAIAEIFYPAHNKGLLKTRNRNKDSFIQFSFQGSYGYYCTSNTSNSAIQEQHAIPTKLWDEAQGYFFGYDAPQESELQKYKVNHSRFDKKNTTSNISFTFAAFAYSGLRTINQTDLQPIQEIPNSPFENSLSFHNTTRPSVLLQWIANNRMKAALASFDKDQNAVNFYENSLNKITSFIKEICDLNIEFTLHREPLSVGLKINNETITFDGLPDGLKSIISWVGDLSLRLEEIPWQTKGDPFSQPIILLLDEIDVHLHPKWQRKILPALQNLLPNSQIFVSTHSPFVVGSVNNAWVYSLPEPSENHQIPKITATEAKAGESYRAILEEIFSITEEFDTKTEALFNRFYTERTQFINTQIPKEDLLKTARQIADRGEETRNIILRELKQLSRITAQSLEITIGERP